MLLVTLTLLSLITTNIQGCGESNFADFCWDDPSIATITYDSTTAELKCENYIQDQVACTAVEALLAEKTEEDLTSEFCEELCDVSHADATTDDTLKCEFFRWEKDLLHCTLMNSVQCDAFNPCERGKCVSGQTGCNGGDNPLPTDAKCAAGVEFIAGSVHWVCVDPNDLLTHINIYGTDKVPAGVTCRTAHKCKDFDNDSIPDPEDDAESNSLNVICDAKSAAGDDEQKWIKNPGSKNDPTKFMGSNQLTLVDPGCIELADSLDLNKDKLHETGVSFICEILENLEFTTDKVTVSAPNTCALLCNLHHALTLENELSEAGNGVWKRYDAGSDEGIIVNETNKDDVACWNLMEL